MRLHFAVRNPLPSSPGHLEGWGEMFNARGRFLGVAAVQQFSLAFSPPFALHSHCQPLGLWEMHFLFQPEDWGISRLQYKLYYIIQHRRIPRLEYLSHHWERGCSWTWGVSGDMWRAM